MKQSNSKLPQHFARMQDGGAKPGASFQTPSTNSSWNYMDPKGIGGKSSTQRTWQGTVSKGKKEK